jgi:hypothetical protein
MERFVQEVAQLYQRHIISTGKQPQAVILVSFLVTFLLVRGITYSIHTERKRILRNLVVGGRHIHHLVWGILLLLVTGYLAIAFDPRRAREELALLFGIGAALTLDEFALWLDLQDVYWAKEGRKSVDAVIIATVVLALVLLGWSFWQAVGRVVARLLRLD